MEKMIDLFFWSCYSKYSSYFNLKTQMLAGGNWRGQQYSVTSSSLGLN